MIVIRPFAPADAEAVHQVSADTARFGDPVELILDDRRLFIDIFPRPYTTHYAATCWVAETEGRVVGYLTGCPDTAGYQPVFRRALIRTVGRALVGRYRLGRRTVRAGIGYLRELLRGALPVDLALYPAHLHINLAAPYRGQGVGRRLMLAYLEQCRARGIPGVHLTTSDQNRAAVHLYHALGFDVLYRYRSPYRSMISCQPVEGLIMGLRLE